MGCKLGPRDVVLVFTDDPKFDEPALTGALGAGAGYVCALGSRRAGRAGPVPPPRPSAGGMSLRLHAPCGLDLGARTPEETALSILAEVVAARTGRSGESLRATSGPIHGDTEPADAIDTEDGP